MLISVGLGLIVGVILALTGAGGGVLAVPLLVFGIGLRVADAGPIALLAVGMAAALGAVLGLKAGTVRYKAALLMAGTGMLSSPFGIGLANRVDNRGLSILFAIVLLLVAYRTFRQAHDRPKGAEQIADRTPPCIRDSDSGRFLWTARCAGVLALSGGVTGLLSGLLGVGGGFVLVPVLQRYTDLAMQAVVSTSLAVIALVSVSGVVSGAIEGNLNWKIAVPFCAGSLAGMIGGRLMSSRMAGAQLQYGFAAVSTLVAVVMIGKSIL